MKTKIFDLKDGIDLKKLQEAANIIKSGGLVATPTETVYGLAADGLNPKAVSKIFEAKQRPMDNPLILHIAKIEDIYRLSINIKESDIKILEDLWPGPLTVVVQKSEIIPDEVSAGLETVAIRIPGKELTRKFIDYCDTPLAAPSANLSTKPSPASAKSVLEDMEGRIEGVIDGGECEIGIESTVLDLTSDIPKILRPGYYTKTLLEQYWDKVEIDTHIKDESKAPKSPGQKYKHYAPTTEVLVLIGDDERFFLEVLELSKSKKIGLMAFEKDIAKFPNLDIIDMGNKNELYDMGRILFEGLRELDKKDLDLIVVRGVEEESFGLSIMNRLKKAASGNIRRV